jgi:hypothetical protein
MKPAGRAIMNSRDGRSTVFTGIMLSFIFTESIFPQAGQKTISDPSRLFNVPMADVLRSAEVCVSGGSSFGMESKSALIQNFAVGLGGIAEAEISTAGLANELTGESEPFAMSSFKVNLIPECFQRCRLLPNVVVQLKSSSWKNIRNGDGAIRSFYTAASSYSGENLLSLDIKERFSVLSLIIGKRWPFLGFQAGVCATDIRLKDGRRWFYTADNEGRYVPSTSEIPEMQKNYWAPTGGIEIRANDKTKIMAEIQSVPVFDFDVPRQKVVISRAWLGVAGIRFFISNWLTLDAGVKYQSSDKGIADAEIRLGGNCVIPVNDWVNKIVRSGDKRPEK